MRAIFDAVTFRQQRGWSISSAAPHQALLVPSSCCLRLDHPLAAQQQRSNVLVIMGDDIGYWNISVYNRGMMAYRTPNIDRIANEGAIFTDYRGQQPCTAGRAAFITGRARCGQNFRRWACLEQRKVCRHRILRRELRSPPSKTMPIELTDFFALAPNAIFCTITVGGISPSAPMLLAPYRGRCRPLLGRRGVPASGDTLGLQVTLVTLDSRPMK